MKWFVASFISIIESNDSIQSEFPVYEDFILFSASTEEELQEKLEKEKKLINAAGECNFQGKPARKHCIGIRKIRSIYNDSPSIDSTPPSDGTELTHSFMSVCSIQEAELLAQGKSVHVLYIDDDDE